MTNNTIKSIETIDRYRLVKRVNNEATSYYIFLVDFKAHLKRDRYIAAQDIILIFDDDLFEYYDYEKDTLTDREQITAKDMLIQAQLDTYIGLDCNAFLEHLDNRINYYKNEYRLWLNTQLTQQQATHIILFTVLSYQLG